MEDESKKRFLVMGPMGCGKSTLANALINGNVDPVSLRQPLATGDDLGGCQDRCIANSDGEFTIIDTVGVTDNRSSLEEHALRVVKLLWSLRDGINGILFCIPKGRADRETRNALQAVLKIFDARQFADMSLLAITCDDDGRGADWMFRQVNDLRDRDAMFIWEAVGKRCVTGSFLSFPNDTAKDNVFVDDRRRFLGDLQNEMRTYNAMHKPEPVFQDTNLLLKIIAEILSSILGEPIPPTCLGVGVRDWIRRKVEKRRDANESGS